ncbi:DMT family transporter [Dinghuibacter silviterrae]|uniref:Multidrug transporter EmrE-like cation transporter n=1 Tax=Dinghuibacter silviterrae TaxID=1539049 RepID=A0A4R8DU69_9BACT|nr:multidrug transporter EmrE-like cation transporter [Dinghuibacter silviterrae]
MGYVLLAISTIINCLSYLVLKAVSGKSYSFQWVLQFTGGLILAGITTFLFTRSLKELKLSVAYPIFCGVSIILVLLTSWMAFHEKISLLNFMGAIVIIAGVYMVSVR